MYADHFSLANIPFGVASSGARREPAIATRLGDEVVFLPDLIGAGLLSDLSDKVLETLRLPTLNAFAALPKASHRDVRGRLQAVLSEGLKSIPTSAISHIDKTTMHLPLTISEFTDFSCSKDHVLNAGEAITKSRKFPPGFLHFPVGYAGRSSSIVVSGTPIRRPWGQFRSPDSGSTEVLYAPTQQLDYELEVACIVGKPLAYGRSVTVAEAEEHIFGLVLLNDWSARDIQSLEMIPLGPLNGKNFGTTISPWVITTDALDPFRTKVPPRDIPTASYLVERDEMKGSFDIQLQAELITSAEPSSSPTTICRSRLDSLYWSFRHLVAHQSVGGCGLRTGDILATGTVSGSTPESHGCLLEKTKGGVKAFEVGSDTDPSTSRKRIYLEDGDEIRITAWAGWPDGTVSSGGVGFGECLGRIVRGRDATEHRAEN